MTVRGLPHSGLSTRTFSVVVVFALLAATIGVLGRTSTYPFVGWDDPEYVTQNEIVRSGLTRESIVWAFTDTKEANWHPVTWLSHMSDVEIHGLDAGGHHRTNVLIHFANSVLVYFLFLSMTGAPARSAAVAMLFAIHPLHVEPVAWVSERKELASTFFPLLASGAYVAHVRRGMSWRSALVTLFFALALMSKAMPVTLPFVFLLLDYWPLRRAWSIGLIAEKLPLLLLSVAASMVAVVTQRGAGAVVQVDFVPMLSRAANAILSYGLYLAKIVWPADLIPFYPHPYIPDTGGLQPGVTTIVGWSLLLGVISVWIARQRGRPWARVGWCWFLGTLVPVIGLVQIGRQGMADRYMYFPSIGLFIIVVWGVGELVDRLRARPLVVAGIGLASAAALIALGATAWRQTGYWQDSISLFRHGIEIEPRNVTLRFNVANFLRDEGRLDEAVSQYRLILELTPAASGPNLNLANVLRRQGRFEEAISHYERAIAGEPDYALAHVNLASALRSVGRFDEAIAHYERALALGPSRVTLFNLANLHHARRDYAKAIDAYERALERAPADPRIHKNLGLSLLADHQVDRAITHFRQALRLQPSHADAANNLGVALEEQGRIDEAIEAYRQAIRIAPDHSRARSNLALLLESRGRVEKAPPE